MFAAIVLASVLFLAWLGVIPIKQWVVKFRARMIGASCRAYIAACDNINRILKKIGRALDIL